MNDPDFEGVAVEAEVPLDPAHQTFHPGVRPDGPPAPAGAVGAYEARGESLLVGLANELLERAPVCALDLLE